MSGSYVIQEIWSMADFGKNLSRLRKARHLTQLKLSELIGVQPRLIGRWEQGQGKPHFDYLVKLADALDVSFDQLLRGDEATSTPTFEVRNKTLQELCKKADRLNREDQDLICQFLDMAIRSNQIKEIVANR